MTTSTVGKKKDYLCVVQGCESRRERGNWRCERHSVAYYGGYFHKDISPEVPREEA